jgi:hypothetical protein
MLRGCSSGESELAFPDQHQIANINKRVWKVSQYADRVPPENKIQAHQNASGDAPVPKRHWYYTFALSLRGEPLDKETHREKSVPDKTENHNITPIQTKESVFFSNPGDSDNGEHIHRQSSSLPFRFFLHKGEVG